MVLFARNDGPYCQKFQAHNQSRLPDACVRSQKSLRFGHQPKQSFSVMALTPAPRIVPDLKPKFEVSVDLDDRSFLFPAGEPVARLLLLSDGNRIFIEGVFP